MTKVDWTIEEGLIPTGRRKKRLNGQEVTWIGLEGSQTNAGAPKNSLQR